MGLLSYVVSGCGEVPKSRPLMAQGDDSREPRSLEKACIEELQHPTELRPLHVSPMSGHFLWRQPMCWDSYPPESQKCLRNNFKEHPPW